MQQVPAIHFDNVSKRFDFTPDTPQTILESVIATFSRRRNRAKRELWAVRDISFEVMPGASLGIIGRNGSGKSTLLKLAARILRPTRGQVYVRGRLSALLELGAGFHPDLTGRENIFLNGSILGLGKHEIDRNYQDIVDFSELDEFIDMPVKHYSSGMYMRLGFSVAVHVDPEVLIVDEILAVGDQSFQNKCIERIYDLKRKGTTIVLVSHNLDTVRNLCSHLLWMEKGWLRAAGPAAEVAAQYLEYAQGQNSKRLPSPNGESPFRRWGSGEIEIRQVRFLDADGKEQTTFKTGDTMTMEIAYVAHEAVYEPEFGLAIFRQDGVQVNGPNNQMAGLALGTVSGAGFLRYQIDNLYLVPGLYRVTAAVHNHQVTQAYDYHEQAYPFRVIGGASREMHGVVDLPASWQWEPDREPFVPL